MRESPAPQILVTANMAEGTSTKFPHVPDVDIDANGRFKYILIKVMDTTQAGTFKYIVRGFDWADYHGKLTNQMLHDQAVRCCIRLQAP